MILWTPMKIDNFFISPSDSQLKNRPFSLKNTWKSVQKSVTLQPYDDYIIKHKFN